MAFSPVTPIEIGSTNYSVSGAAQYVPSGTVTSGTSAFPGPYLIETQSMNIDYVRVPRGFASNFNVSLSAASMSHAVQMTEVVALVTAEYKREKVYNTFSTSSYTQPQTFQILAMSSDPSGNSYGALTASTLGPMGTIATYQPYHSRKPWNDTIDTTALQTCYGANFVLVNESANTDSGRFDVNPEEYITEFKQFFINSSKAGTFLNDLGEPEVLQTIGDMYRLFGSYAPSQESVPKIITYIDSLANRVTANLLTFVPQRWDQTNNPNPYTKTGCSGYSATRHDYSQFY